MAVLVRPDLDTTWRWLDVARHPAAELLLRRAGLEVPWGKGRVAASAELLADPALTHAFSMQRDDGSWGIDDRADARILSTLWVVKTLIEAGLDAAVNQVDAALTFLAHYATTSDGYFTISGTDMGVLPCYVGLAARVFRDAGRGDLVETQTQWLTRHQQVSVAGQTRREAAEWGHGLDHRYGGCFSSTSCLIGIVRATEVWREGDRQEHRDAYACARDVLHERSLAFTRDGKRLLDLPAPARTPSAWTLPAFPSDWRVDLIDVIHAVARSPHGADPRAQRAVDVLMASRREDGSWARGWHVTSPFLKGFAVAPRGRGNPIATTRAFVALTLLAPNPEGLGPGAHGPDAAQLGGQWRGDLSDD